MQPDTNHWFAKQQIDESLTMLSEPFVHSIFSANIWHLRGKDLDLVIDSGMGLANLSAALDLTPGKPILAVATHAHVDHVGSLHEFQDRAGPKVEAAAFETMDDRVTYADLFRDLDEPVTRLPSADWHKQDFVLRPAPLTRLLEEGDVIDTGDRRFHVLHLPGHSPGSIGLFDEADGTFFSGDAIYDSTLYDELPDSDPAAYCRTMDKIEALPARIVHAGHAGSFDGSKMRAIARGYLARRRA